MPPTASLPRLARILVLVPWVIQHPDDATVEEVCRRFDVPESALIEDLNLLLVCGLPPFTPGDMIEAGVEDGRVVIRMADYLSRPLRLTRWEALSLLAAGRAIASLPGLKEAPALESALAKLAAAIAPDEVDAAAILAERVAIELEPASPQVLDALRDAIERRRTVRMEYYSFGRDAMSERSVDPLLVFGARPWYLVAFDHPSQERRTFRVDRIRSLEVTDGEFERPEGFDPNAEADQPLYRPSPGDVEVVVELAPEASWVAEVTPHDGVADGAGGWMRMTLHASHLSWLARLALQLGERMRVVEPASLREDVRALAARTLERYRS